MNTHETPQPNYEQLYYTLNNRRGAELALLTQLASCVTGLICTFHATDRIAADYTEIPSEALPEALNQYIHAFLWKLAPCCAQTIKSVIKSPFSVGFGDNSVC